MIYLTHPDSNGASPHHWPFVYFHGRAEQLYADLDAAPDLVTADRAKSDVSPGVHHCQVRGYPALLVLAADGSGRVALLDDPAGLAHVLDVPAWR